MPEEAKEVESTVEVTEPSLDVVKEENVVPVDEKPKEELVSFSGRKALSDEELANIPDEPETSEKTESSESVKDTASAQPVDDKAKPDEKVKEEKKIEAPPELVAQVKNLNSGIYQERERVKEARREILNLKSELAVTREKLVELTDKTVDPEFQVLSEEDEIELADSEPAEHARYLIKLRKHNDAIRAKKDAEREEELGLQQTKNQNKTIINSVFDSIKEAVPGIYDNNGSMQTELGVFATENGFDPEFITYLSDPGTMIMPRITTKNGTREYITPQLLGKGAKSMVVLLHNLHKKLKGVNPETLKSELENQIRLDEREKVNKTWLEKLDNKSGKRLPTLSDVASVTDGKKPGKPRNLTRAELSRLSDSDREAYLQE
jgi:hypothetical protein